MAMEYSGHNIASKTSNAPVNPRYQTLHIVTYIGRNSFHASHIYGFRNLTMRRSKITVSKVRVH